MEDMNKHPVHPYYQAILDIYAEKGRPSYNQLSPQQGREMLRTSLAAAPPQSNLPVLASVRNETLSSQGRDIPIRRYVPEGEPYGVCVYFHAGGWVIGDLDTADALCRRLAAAAGCELVSVDYRLAPEHPFPAPLDDAYDVLQWAAEKGEPLLVAGESAGGNLAAAATIRSREESGPEVVGQLLAYPVTDHDFTTLSYRQLGSRDLLLSEAEMRWFWDQYCPASVERNNPLVSPLRVEDAGGLPPALICVAGLDPLRDEGLAYAQHLAAAGVPVQTRCDPGVLHGYFSAAGSVPAAAEAVSQAALWMKQRLQSTIAID